MSRRITVGILFVLLSLFLALAACPQRVRGWCGRGRDRRRRQPAHRRVDDPFAFSRRRRRAIRCGRARRGPQEPLRDRAVPGRDRFQGRGSHSGQGRRKSDDRKDGVRGQQENQGRGPQENGAIESGRAAGARRGPRRCRAHHRALPPARLFRGARRSANDPRQGRARQSRVRDQGGREARSAADPLHRQQCVRGKQAQRRDQERRDQSAELPPRQRRLQCRPHRRRPRPPAPLLSRPRLCRRARALGRELRGGQEGHRAHVRDRGRPALSPGPRRGRIGSQIRRCGRAQPLPAHASGRDLQCRCREQDRRGCDHRARQKRRTVCRRAGPQRARARFRGLRECRGRRDGNYQSRLRRRTRQTRLCRAHRHSRRHQDARRGDPARIRFRRRRRLQPRAGRARRTPAEGAGLFQVGQDRDAAGLRARPHRHRRHRRGGPDRKFLYLRRLFNGRPARSPR